MPTSKRAKHTAKSSQAVKFWNLPSRELRRLDQRAYRAQQKGHFEVCGVVGLDSRGKLHLHFIENRKSSPYTYEFNSDDVRAARQALLRKHLRPVASFHSHPVGDAHPSADDKKRGFYRGRELIYDVCGREAILWRRTRRGGRSRFVRELLRYSW